MAARHKTACRSCSHRPHHSAACAGRPAAAPVPPLAAVRLDVSLPSGHKVLLDVAPQAKRDPMLPPACASLPAPRQRWPQACAQQLESTSERLAVGFQGGHEVLLCIPAQHLDVQLLPNCRLVQDAVQVAAVPNPRAVDARDDVTEDEAAVVVAAGAADAGAPGGAALAGVEDEDAWG